MLFPARKILLIITRIFFMLFIVYLHCLRKFMRYTRIIIVIV